MYRKLLWGVSFVLVFGLSGMPAIAQNQIRNWEFDEPFVTGGGGNLDTHWWLWEAANFTGLSVVQGAGLSGDNAMMVAIPPGATGSLQVYQSFMVLEQGVTYTISFMAKADAPRTINVRLMGRTLYNWQTFWGQTGIQLTTEPQTFTFEYEHTGETVGGTGVFNDDIDWCFDHGGSDISAYYDRIWLGQEPPPSPDIASNPIPADGAIHEDTWVSLSWEPGSAAVSHDVYLGDNFDDVAKGMADTFRGNQMSNFYLAGFPGYAYPEGLVPGTTYYWRVDEINDQNPNSPWEGDVWSFTIPSMEAFNPVPADGADSVSVNTQLSWTPGYGAKLHTVYFGDNFETVANATVGLPSGTASYNPGPLKAAKLYYWRVDEFDGRTTYKGNVWSFGTEGGISNPNPADGAVDVAQTPTLTWTAGVPAASHAIYFGTDSEVVRNATTASPEYKGTTTLGDENFEPGKLAWDTSYYWRVDEVNETNPDSPWTGPVWSFTTAGFAIVEDFESYTDNDADNEAIWQSWIDGFGVADNGSQVGYLLPPYAEQATVHGGLQAMPLFYNNEAGVTNSEAVMTLTSTRDWTEEGITELSLWFHGLPASVGSFVEAPAGTYTITAEGTDIWGTADEFHYAFKVLNGSGSMETQVLSVQNTNGWAKAGVMIRETLDPGSKFAAVYITPGNGCRFQARMTADADATSDTDVVSSTQTAITAPYRVRIERDAAGNFRGYYSSNGTTWQSMTWNPQNIPMSSNVYIGLALTSHSAGVICQAMFSDVQTTGAVSGQWTNQDIGLSSNAAEPLYVAISNSAGSPAVVAHDDPGAATIDDWTQWRISLQAFADQGINLGNVDKIAIGLGTQSDLAASGGSGTIYIDDIRLYRP